MFTIPVKVEPIGLEIDVDRNLESRISLKGNRFSEVAYTVQSGINSSMMEHMIWDNLFQQDGISAIKILQIANQQGIPIYQLKQDNVSRVIPNLQVSAALKTEIQNLINAGHIVTIPHHNISYNSWYGIAYIDLDQLLGRRHTLYKVAMQGGSLLIGGG